MYFLFGGPYELICVCVSVSVCHTYLLQSQETDMPPHINEDGSSGRPSDLCEVAELLIGRINVVLSGLAPENIVLDSCYPAASLVSYMDGFRDFYAVFLHW